MIACVYTCLFVYLLVWLLRLFVCTCVYQYTYVLELGLSLELRACLGSGLGLGIGLGGGVMREDVIGKGVNGRGPNRGIEGRSGGWGVLGG